MTDQPKHSPKKYDGAHCPACGSDQITAGGRESNGVNEIHQECECNNCETTWTELYRLAGCIGATSSDETKEEDDDATCGSPADPGKPSPDTEYEFVCPECGAKDTAAVRDIVYAGGPMCVDCDEDMVLADDEG